MNIPKDKNYPPTAAQCHGCGGYGCVHCCQRGWVKSGHSRARHCYNDACKAELAPSRVAVYCSNSCAMDDA